MLTISKLRAYAGDNEILKGVDLTINPGETHVIMGPNGAGKSTLASVIMGHPDYTVTEGRIAFEGKDITYTKTDERARSGIFMTFQNPEEVDGITVESFLRTARYAITGNNERAWDFHKELKELMARLDFDESYATRYLNVKYCRCWRFTQSWLFWMKQIPVWMLTLSKRYLRVYEAIKMKKTHC